MGTDINGIFGHREPLPPTDSVVKSMRKGLGGEWDLPGDYNPGSGLVYVHGKVSIAFGPHAGIVSTGYGWLEDRDDQGAAVDAIRAIARFFRSPGVIFLPDDIEPYVYASQWIAEGSTFDDLKRRLAAIKEPSADFRAAIRQMPNCYEVDGYVIEELDHGAG
jgi:hypothetical protein